jgi:transposase
MWMLKGRQKRIPSAGVNRRVPVFGALNPLSGRLTAHVARGKNSAEYVRFLKRLIASHGGRHVFLFTDNCSIHHARCVMRFLAEHKESITVIWNAPYTPELNLIERYWGHLKQRAIYNYYFETKQALEQAIRDSVSAFNKSKELNIKINLDYLNSLCKAA